MELNPGAFVLLIVGVLAVIVGFKGTQNQVGAVLTGGRSTTTTGPSVTTTSATTLSAPTQATGLGAYANPLRGLSGLVPERVDQGVDYGGHGPIYALGPGTVENVSGAGWPGGTFIEYVLTGGPLAGQHVYAAEDITPSVRVGQSVDANTVLGVATGGPSGIETGFADPNAAAQRALAHGDWNGTNSTAWGQLFNDILAELGAPAGHIVGPVHGNAALPGAA